MKTVNELMLQEVRERFKLEHARKTSFPTQVALYLGGIAFGAKGYSLFYFAFPIGRTGWHVAFYLALIVSGVFAGAALAYLAKAARFSTFSYPPTLKSMRDYIESVDEKIRHTKTEGFLLNRYTEATDSFIQNNKRKWETIEKVADYVIGFFIALALCFGSYFLIMTLDPNGKVIRIGQANQEGKK